MAKHCGSCLYFHLPGRQRSLIHESKTGQTKKKRNSCERLSQSVNLAWWFLSASRWPLCAKIMILLKNEQQKKNNVKSGMEAEPK
jgi:hypothetical protein